MSTETVQEGGNGEVECRNAREYALNRLEEEAGEILTSEDLAEEYQCTQGHMQTVLRELSKSGEIKRLGWGRYAAISEDSEEENTGYQREKADDIPSGDGGHQLQGTDTTEMSQDDEGPIQCPADDCDYEGFSVEGFRKHSNAVYTHDWEDIRDELDWEELSESEGSEDLEESEMVSKSELHLQRDLGIGNVDEGDSAQLVEDDRDDQDGDGDEEIVEEIEATTESGMPGIPVQAVAVVAVVAFLVWWFFIRSGPEPAEPQQEQEETDPFDGTGLIGGV